MNSAPNCTALRPQLELQVKRLNSRILQERRKIGQRKREQIKARVSEGTTAEREAYRMVRDAPAPTLLFVQKEDGTVTAKPDEVDEAVIAAWSEVYDGNVDNEKEQVGHFLLKYREH